MKKIILLTCLLLLLTGCFPPEEKCPTQKTSFEVCYEYCQVITKGEKEDLAQEEYNNLFDGCVNDFWDRNDNPEFLDIDAYNYCGRRYGYEEHQKIKAKWDDDYAKFCLDKCAGGS